MLFRSPLADPPVLRPVHAPEPGTGDTVPERREIPSAVWIAGAGAVIFLIGVIYFLTVSIQRGWVSPGVRVLGGAVTGAALGYGAVRLLRGSARSLGVALLAAGLGTWTFAFYYGAQQAHLFPVGVGFGGAVAATMLAGFLAARVRSDGALGAGLVTGLIAPLAFSRGTGSMTLLLVYLVLLVAAQLAAVYATGTGGDWSWSRLASVLGTWMVFAIVVADGHWVLAAGVQLGLVALLGGAVLVLAWLPRHPEQPSGPGAMTVLNLVAVAAAGPAIWDRTRLPIERMSGWLLGLALVSAALIGPARKRMGNQAHDLPLLLLAVGFLMVAVPVALDWNWVLLAWGVIALLLAAAAWATTRVGREDAGALRWVAALTSVVATGHWIFHAVGYREGDMAVVNKVFITGVILALAWGFISRTAGPWRMLGFVLLQFVAVNNLAWELMRSVPAVRLGGSALSLGHLLATLVYAASGAVAWFRGVSMRDDGEAAKVVRVCGYAWLAWATGKLLLHDLAGTELLFRALAAFGVGAIFIAAALLANRRATRAARGS